MSHAAPAQKTARLDFEDNDMVRALCGAHNEHLKLIERRLGVQVGSRGGQIVISSGDEERMRQAETLVRELYELIASGYPLYLEDVDQATKLAGRVAPEGDLRRHGLRLGAASGHHAEEPRPEALHRGRSGTNDIVFGIGPAGTGKTYLAMAMAVAFLASGRSSASSCAGPRSRQARSSASCPATSRRR